MLEDGLSSSDNYLISRCRVLTQKRLDKIAREIMEFDTRTSFYERVKDYIAKTLSRTR